MGRDFKKIKATSSSDEELLKECMKQVPCDKCDSITWSEPDKGNRIDPPLNTVAVVVDLVNTIGAIRVYDQQGPYVSGVGTAEAGSLIIVPWNTNWWFYVAGNLKVGLVFGS